MYEVSEIIDKKTIFSVIKEKKFANICGCILYTEAHPNIAKVLRDDDYWRCFDKISSGWPIFALKPKSELQREQLRRSYSQQQSSSNLMINMMIPVKDTSDNLQIFLDLFDIDESSLPCFMLFALINEDDIISCHIKLKNSTIDIVFKDLEDIVNNITRAKSYITPENIRGQGVFRQAENSVEGMIYCKNLKNKLKIIPYIKGILSEF